MLSKSPGHASVDLTFLRFVGNWQGEVPINMKNSISLIKKVSFKREKSKGSNIPGISRPNSADEIIESVNKKPATPLRKFAKKIFRHNQTKISQ